MRSSKPNVTKDIARTVLEEVKAIIDEIYEKHKIDFSSNIVDDFYNEVDKMANRIRSIYRKIDTDPIHYKYRLKEFLMSITVRALCRRAYKEIGQDINYDTTQKFVDGIFCRADLNICAKVLLVDPIFTELMCIPMSKVKEVNGGLEFSQEDIRRSGKEVIYRNFTFFHFRYQDEFYYVLHTIGNSSMMGEIGDFWQVVVLSKDGLSVDKDYQHADNKKLQTKLLEITFDCLFFLLAKKDFGIKEMNVSSICKVDWKRYLEGLSDYRDLKGSPP